MGRGSGLMKFNIEKSPQGLDNLAIVTGVDEGIDYGCEFLTARDDAGHLLGAAGVNFKKEQYPRFEHIIIAPKYQKGKLAARLMLKIEDWIKSLGYKKYLAFIYHETELMHRYAKKFKMIPYANRPKGIWYSKEV